MAYDRERPEADRSGMSVVACTGIGSRGVEFSPTQGAATRGACILDRNVDALRARGIDLAEMTFAGPPNEVDPVPARSDEDVSAWISAQAVFRDGSVPPIVVAGLRSTSMLRGVWRSTAEGKDGYTPRIWVVEPDMARARQGLGEADLASIISDARVEFVVGQNALGRFREALSARLDTPMQHLCVSDDGEASELTSDVGRVLEAVARLQEQTHARLRARVAAIYAERDVAWWARRFTTALSGGEPLRVLLPSCRYTTFVQHAARDLAVALSRQGLQAEVLIERDPHSRLSSVAYLERLAVFRPDLVVLINYPRPTLGLDMPRNVPVMCWMQDAMPHLFDSKVGESQGVYDFVMGHVFPELYSKFSYPMDRTMPAVVVADGAKFHRNATSGERRGRACEIALVSHHSETPEAMHERLKREVGKDPGMVRVLEALRPAIERIMRGCNEHAPIALLRRGVERVWREQMGDDAPPRALTLLQNNYALPLADRILRHETVAWAAEMARRRGWRLGLYGRGWARHPDYAEFAKGEISHDDALRQVYAASSVHLHASLTATVHQRVIECVLSGGVCLIRLTRDSIAAPRATLTRRLLHRQPDVEEEHRIGYVIADHADAIAFSAMLQRVGYPSQEPIFWVPKLKAESTRRLASLHVPEQDANWAFGDLGEIGFTSPERLEILVERAIEQPDWRQGVSHMCARRVEAHLTHDALAKRLIAFVADRFAASCESLRRAA